MIGQGMMAKRMAGMIAVMTLTLGLIAAPLAASAQAAIDFGGLRADPTLPVEVTSESFTVDQADHSASFAGSVRVVQGEMVLAAEAVRILYAEDGTTMVSLEATGGVVLTAGTDSATAERALYLIATAEVTLDGGVTLTQGSARLRGERLWVNLAEGTGRMEGGVTTTFTPRGGG